MLRRNGKGGRQKTPANQQRHVIPRLKKDAKDGVRGHSDQDTQCNVDHHVH